MKRIALRLAYEGTTYHGWAPQPGRDTVCGRLIGAVKDLTGTGDVMITGASRTDAGVHALDNLAVFDTEADLSEKAWVKALNVRLPRTISVTAAAFVPDDFSPHRAVKKKTYVYSIDRGETANPLLRTTTAHIYGPMDLCAMNEAAGFLVGSHDFTSFCNVKSQVEDKVRIIYALNWTETLMYGSPVMTMRVTGNGFLYNMVRIIAGTLIEVGRGRKSIEEVEEALSALDRTRAGMTAPASGLMLERLYLTGDAETLFNVKREKSNAPF